MPPPHEPPPQARTFVYVTYTNGGFKDTGIRPLPSHPDAPAFYQCPGILIDGAPYTGELLMPGTQHHLSARVTNAGAFEGSVTVRFYPSEPATGLDPIKLLPGATPFTVPAGATLTSPAVPFVLAFDQPSHICLFAEVTAPLDFPDGSGNPVKDRHYAQQNLQFHKVQRGQRLAIPFLAIGAAQRKKHLVAVRQLDVEEGDGRPRLVFPPGSLRITDREGGVEPQERLLVELQRWQSQPLRAEVMIPQEATVGAVGRVVIEQLPLDDHGVGPTGAITITLHVTD